MKFVFHKPYSVAREDGLVPIPADGVRKPEKPLLLKPAALEAFQEMRRSAAAENVFLLAISSHRSFSEQAALFRKAEERHGRGRGILWVAPPGYSEHHTGYVLDLADKTSPETDDEPGFEKTSAFAWLDKNAARFGFRLSFPEGNWQGVGYEPWHYRFEGDLESRRIFSPHPLRRFPALALCLANGIYRRLSL